MAITSFFPENYELPDTSTDYLKLDEGDNKIRILTDLLPFEEGWKDNKPFRRSAGSVISEDEVDIDAKYGKPKINHGWGIMVYDYKTDKVKPAQFNQKTIQKGLQNLIDDPDWGAPDQYDVTIIKTTEGPRTSYSIKSAPPKPLAKAIQAVVDEAEPTFDLVKTFGIES